MSQKEVQGLEVLRRMQQDGLGQSHAAPPRAPCPWAAAADPGPGSSGSSRSPAAPIRCSLDLGTSAASRCRNSSGLITRCVLPSGHGVLSLSSTCPASLSCTRSSASAGRVMYRHRCHGPDQEALRGRTRRDVPGLRHLQESGGLAAADFWSAPGLQRAQSHRRPVPPAAGIGFHGPQFARVATAIKVEKGHAVRQVAEPAGDHGEAPAHRAAKCMRREHRQAAHHPDATLCQRHWHGGGEASGVTRELRIPFLSRIPVPA